MTERDILPCLIRVPLNEFWSEQDVRDTAQAIHKVAAYFGAQSDGADRALESRIE